jgi:outer membrane protein
MKTLFRSVVAGLFLNLTCLAAQAADLPAPQASEPPMGSPLGLSHWLFRLRAMGIVPDSNITVTGTSLRSIATDAILPEVDITYFFTKNIAAEVVVGASPGWIKMDMPGPRNGYDLGKTIVVAPNVIFQYHFTDLGPVKPYVGVGVNYSFFMGTQAKGLDALSIRPNAALAFQLGADYFINQHWGINVDVKKLLLRTTYTGNATTAFGAPFIYGKARLDPWLLGVGISYRF